MATYQLRKKEALAQRQWHVADAEGKVLGRLASQIAMILRGKHKPNFTPHADGGDFVIVINAGRVKLTGSKNHKKVYYRHSEYPGGIRTTTAEKLLAENPQALVRLAVKGMLPKNRLGRRLFSKLKVYAGSDHPHSAQKPQQMVLVEE